MLGRRGLMLSAAASGAQTLARPALAAPGGRLSVAIFADPLSVDPHLTGNVQGRAATRAIHDTLFTVDQEGRLAPGLVEKWEQPDRKTYVFPLRQGVRFHAGTPFAAAAVKF